MEKKEQISQEAIERFNCEHLQEIKAVCELVEWSMLTALNNGMYKDGILNGVLWEIADDITRNTIGIMEAFCCFRFSNADYAILEEIVYNLAYDYLTKHGVTIYEADEQC